MRLCVTVENRFKRTPDGAVWTITPFPYSFWLRYLDVFDEVCIIARGENTSAISTDWKRVDGKHVSFAPVPHYLGPWQYLSQAKSVRQAVIGAVKPEDAVIFRVPSNLASCVQPLLHRVTHPYGVEVVGDPYDVFSPGGVKHPLRIFFRWWFSQRLRRQCQEACALSYVTAHSLQKRYPPGPQAFTTSYSSIQLEPSAFVSTAKKPERCCAWFSLVFVGSLAQMYKAPDVLIDATARCVQQYQLNVEVVIIGDGKYRQELEARACTSGLEEHIKFLGEFPDPQSVQVALDKADLFVLPSRHEGLPRAMIEAMARGLPCIGSSVGGIPELLSAEDMVPPGDVDALARKIREVLTSPERMGRMAARNLEKAKEYRSDLLQRRRIQFYRYLRNQMENKEKCW